MRLERNSEAEDLKAIDQLLDSLPVLTEEQLELAAFMKERLFCTYSDAVRLMLPAGYHNAVSYTHLDVYKRQISCWASFSTTGALSYCSLAR